jgi:hypothetical protein
VVRETIVMINAQLWEKNVEIVTRKITSEVEDGNDKKASTTKRAERQVETKTLPSKVSRDRSRYGRTIKKPRRYEQHT